MTQFANAMEVFKLLDKSNCRKCDEPTCLAFASKVFLGQKALDQCPKLDPETLGRFKGPRTRPGGEEDALANLKSSLARCDLAEAAQRTGGVYEDGWLTLRVFGKPFSLDREGRFRTDLHINPWMVGPILTYVLESLGKRPEGNWMAFRELNGGRPKNSLFVQRGERPLKKIADTYPGLFQDLVEMFSGHPLDRKYEADVSLVLYPLPLLPMLVCYWRPDEGMESDLTLFFDQTADENGGSEMIFNLATGMVRMFEKFSLTHGG